MGEGGRSAWHQVGPNDARPNHELGRGKVCLTAIPESGKTYNHS